jgi:ABC-type glycerol-3-phosphate transport system substrate-binding protein
MIALSRQLAKSENGVSYQPLDPGGIVQMASPLSLPAVDPVSNKPVFTTGGWYTVFDVFSRLVEVSGVRDNFQGGPKGTTAFTKDRTMAMVARPLSDMVGPLSQLKEQKIDFNWDMVTYPAYLQAPGKSMGIDIANLVVSSMSKKREEAFAVAAYLTTSEMQTLAARSGRQTALKETAVQQQFGTNVEALKGKNMKALSTVPAGDVVLDKLENLARAELNKARNETVAGKRDLNTILRSAEEATIKAIEREQK